MLMTGAEAIRDGLICAQKKINNILLISEGIADPSSFYGTTKNLRSYFNKNQIIEMPLSESARRRAFRSDDEFLHASANAFLASIASRQPNN